MKCASSPKSLLQQKHFIHNTHMTHTHMLAYMHMYTHKTLHITIPRVPWRPTEHQVDRRQIDKSSIWGRTCSSTAVHCHGLDFSSNWLFQSSTTEWTVTWAWVSVVCMAAAPKNRTLPSNVTSSSHWKKSSTGAQRKWRSLDEYVDFNSHRPHVLCDCVKILFLIV